MREQFRIPYSIQYGDYRQYAGMYGTMHRFKNFYIREAHFCSMSLELITFVQKIRLGELNGIECPQNCVLEFEYFD